MLSLVVCTPLSPFFHLYHSPDGFQLSNYPPRHPETVTILTADGRHLTVPYSNSIYTHVLELTQQIGQTNGLR